MLLKCKPCYNFQSVEFDYSINEEENITEQLQSMFILYGMVIEGLVGIAPEQPDKAKKQTIELATDGQKQIMKVHGIPFDSNTTKKEAQELIKRSIEEASK